MKVQENRVFNYLKQNPRSTFVVMLSILLISFSILIYKTINGETSKNSKNFKIPPLPSVNFNSIETDVIKLNKAYQIVEKLKDTAVLKDSVKLKKLNVELDKLLKNEN